MNNVTLIGRLTKDPEVRWNGDMAIATFTVAIDRPPKKDGTKEADFPRVTVFGRQAENCEKYLSKGRMVGITGRIQTGSYEKDGQRVYTTDVVADRVEFIGGNEAKQEAPRQQMPQQTYTSRQPKQNAPAQMPMGFEAIQDDDIPF